MTADQRQDSRFERYRRLLIRRGESSGGLLPPPSPNRKEYPFVASLVYQGIPIDLEQLKGDVREGVDADGTPWRVKMHAHYGEVRSHARGASGVMGAKGMDGDRLDVYVGDAPDSDLVVVVDQHIPETGEHDEQKVMLGFPSVGEAVACYRRQYTKPGFYGGHKTMTLDQFRQWISQPSNAGRRIGLEKAHAALGARAEGLSLLMGVLRKSHEGADGALRRVFEATMRLRNKTQVYHWNVEGPLFPTLHAMFGEQYSDLAEAVDALAERLRQKQERNLVVIDDAAALNRDVGAVEMLRDLERDHGELHLVCNEAVKLADDLGDAATVDLLSKRAAVHAKTEWFLRSTLVGAGDTLKDAPAILKSVRQKFDAFLAELDERDKLKKASPIRRLAILLMKGKNHKYLARFPTGKAKPKFRYIYRHGARRRRYTTTTDGVQREKAVPPRGALYEEEVSSLVPLASNQLDVGHSYSDGQGGGHWVVTHKSDHELTLRHDETGETKSMQTWDVRDFIDGLHRPAMEVEAERRKAVKRRIHDALYERFIEQSKDLANASDKDISARNKTIAKLADEGALYVKALEERFAKKPYPKTAGAMIKEISELRDILKHELITPLTDTMYFHRPIVTGLLSKPKELRAYVRLLALDEHLQSKGSAVSGERFARALKENLGNPEKAQASTPDELRKAIVKSLKAAGHGRPVSEIKGVYKWDSSIIGGDPAWAKAIKGAVEAELEARGVAVVSARREWVDRDAVMKAQSKLIAEREASQGFINPTLLHTSPEEIWSSDSMPALVDGFDPIDYDGVHYSMRARIKVNERTLKMRAEYDEHIGRVHASIDGIREAIHGVMAPLVDTLAARAAQKDGAAVRRIRRPGHQVAHVHDALRRALGIPEDAHERNASKLQQPSDEELQDGKGPRAPSGTLFEARSRASVMEKAERMLASVHPDVMPEFKVWHARGFGRAHCAGTDVLLYEGDDAVTLWHEAAHAIEHRSDGIAKAAKALWLKRSRGHRRESMANHGIGYESHEQTFVDEWFNPYCGKVYPTGSTEIVSMGVDTYLANPVDFYAKDPEHFLFIAAVVSGSLGKADPIPSRSEATTP